MDCTRIIDNLHIGPCPRTGEDVDVLQDAGITAVLNLQTGEDEAYANIDWPCLQGCYRSRGKKYAVFLFATSILKTSQKNCRSASAPL